MADATGFRILDGRAPEKSARILPFAPKTDHEGSVADFRHYDAPFSRPIFRVAC